MAEENRTIENMIVMDYLNGSNTEFYYRGDFLAMKVTKDGECVDYPRVVLHRLFPFSELETSISVQDIEGEELGMIAKLTDFSDQTAQMLREELKAKYFIPTIREIHELKERFGISTWKVLSDVGEIRFTVRDTYRSMTFLGDGKIYILDVDGNRYLIPDVEKLDRSSYQKIELYI